MSKVVGRKLKIVDGLFYMPNAEAKDNQGIVHSVGVTGNGETVVNLTNFDGCVMPCYLHEVRYLNNRKVVIDG